MIGEHVCSWGHEMVYTPDHSERSTRHNRLFSASKMYPINSPRLLDFAPYNPRGAVTRPDQAGGGGGAVEPRDGDENNMTGPKGSNNKTKQLRHT